MTGLTLVLVNSRRGIMIILVRWEQNLLEEAHNSFFFWLLNEPCSNTEINNNCYFHSNIYNMSNKWKFVKHSVGHQVDILISHYFLSYELYIQSLIFYISSFRV